MTVSERMVGDVAVLALDGRFTQGASADGLSDKVRSLLQQGTKQLLVNLAGVSYMDSGGLGELVHAYATVTKQGGSMKLVNATKRLQDLLVITRLSTVFDSFDDEAEAVGSFGAEV